MTYNIIFSTRSIDDLNNILNYIAETNSPQIALKYVDNIEQTINKLKSFPQMGKLAIPRTLQLQGFRVLTIDSHLIYYKVFEKDQTIKIYTVKHGREKQKL